MPFDQCQAGAARTLVIGVEKIDGDNGPRRDLLGVERPQTVVDNMQDHA